MLTEQWLLAVTDCVRFYTRLSSRHQQRAGTSNVILGDFVALASGIQYDFC